MASGSVRGDGWEVLTLETAGLGNRSYVVVAGDSAIVIDPPRDTGRIEAAVDAAGARLALVVETHRHADYLSGGLVLSREAGVPYAVPGGDPEPRFGYLGVESGRPLTAGVALLRPVHTPGHTLHHMSYVLDVDGADVAVFTGGSMLYGAVGRTDLVEPALTELLAHDQWRSVRHLGALRPDLPVLPTHGFGSFCSAGGGSQDTMSTIGREHQVNPALTTKEAPFVADLVAGYDTFPAHYQRLPGLNARGPGPVDPADTRRLRPEEVRAALGSDTWVVDVRPRSDFSQCHLAGSLSFPLGTPLSVYLPWTAAETQELVLLAPDDGQLAEARGQLANVGLDAVRGAWTGDVAELSAAGELTAYEPKTFVDLAAERDSGRPVNVVDVRRDGEWTTAHVAGARHTPLHDLAREPSLAPVGAWVYCRSGQRAVIAASLLERAGIAATVIDDDFDGTADTSLVIARAESRMASS